MLMQRLMSGNRDNGYAISPKCSLDYILCTIARNEEKNIETVLRDVNAQVVRPKLWILIDDSSDDNTPKIITEYTGKFKWMKLIRFNGKRAPRILLHISRLKAFASECAINIAKSEGIGFEFLGMLDADIHIEPDFYSRMIRRMSEDKEIGLIGAQIKSVAKDGNLKIEKARDDLPGSATMLCRKKCFADIGGVPANMFPEDAIMIARAKLLGWKTERNKSIVAVQNRLSGTKQGYFNGYVLRGERVHYLRYSTDYVALRTVSILVREGPSAAGCFLWGYLKCLIRGSQRLEDKALIEYFRRVRSREAVRGGFGAVLGQFSK